MLPDKRAYLLAAAPVFISTTQLVVRYFTLDMRVMMLADIFLVAVLSCFLRIFFTRDFLFLITGLSIIQTIFTVAVFYVSPLKTIHSIALYIFFPYALALSYKYYNSSDFIKIAIASALSLVVLNLVVMPIELNLRGGVESGLAQLQFSGRSYELIAMLYLALTLTAAGQSLQRGLMSLALLATSFISFSRGALLTVTVILLLTWWRQFKWIFSFYGAIISLSLLLLAYISIPLFEYSLFSDFWSKRTNYQGGTSIYNNLNLFFSDTERFNLWELGAVHISEYPFFGTGVATTSLYIHDITNGVFEYSGYHNFSITALAERGILLGSLFIFLIISIFARLINNGKFEASFYFLGFLFFAHVTGSEVIIHSPQVRNANVLLFLFLIYIYLQRSSERRRV
jgi:O-antigen ligase